MTAPTLPSASPAGSDLTSPTFTSDLIAAIEEGLPVEDYLTARSLGVSDQELTDAFQVGFPLIAYARARQAGATPTELEELYTRAHTNTSAGWDLSRLTAIYATARRGGVTHAELTETLDLDIDPGAYIIARQTDATHDQVLEAEREIGLAGYTMTRRRGATHDQVLEAADHEISKVTYIAAIRAGITHQELIAAAQSGIWLHQYVEYRKGGGVDHQSALADLLAAGSAPPS